VRKSAIDQTLRFEDYERLIHKLARVLYGRACARDKVGVQPSYEDIFQDLCVVWTMCRDAFDHTRGVKFATYFFNAAMNRWRYVARDISRQNATVSISQFLTNEEVDIEDLLIDPNDIDPEANFARKEWARLALERNPLLARLIELSANPPQEFEAELVALKAQREWAKELGVTMEEQVPVNFTPTLLGQTFRFNWRQRLAMKPFEEAA
jgi:hypothetical protein